MLRGSTSSSRAASEGRETHIWAPCASTCDTLDLYERMWCTCPWGASLALLVGLVLLSVVCGPGQHERKEGGSEGRRTRERVCTPLASMVAITSSTAFKRRRARILRVLDMRHGDFLRATREVQTLAGRGVKKRELYHSRPPKFTEDCRNGPKNDMLQGGAAGRRAALSWLRRGPNLVEKQRALRLSPFLYHLRLPLRSHSWTRFPSPPPPLPPRRHVGQPSLGERGCSHSGLPH